MPKNKTHSGAKKRFKITGTGKLIQDGTKMRHNLERKSSKKTRALSKTQIVSKANRRTIKKLLGR
jgi:large subunit ribosomal protein L35